MCGQDERWDGEHASREERSAYGWGVDSRRRGQPVRMNPFDPGSTTSRAWRLGWLSEDKILRLGVDDEGGKEHG